MKYLKGRTVESLSVLLLVAMLIGTAVPVYFRIVQRASQATMLYNIESAQKAVDIVTQDPDMSKMAADPYQVVNAQTMNELQPKFNWRVIRPGDFLPEYSGLSVKDLKSVFILKDNNPRELWIYAVSPNKKILFAYGVDGVWMDSGSVPYQRSFPH